jgi:CheY-like chemotaxis protein
MLGTIDFADIEPPQSVTIVDDDPEDREDLMDQLRDHNIEPRTVNGPYGQDIAQLIADVHAIGSPFVICDHRLQTKNLASFNGSKVVKALSSSKHPAMLLTMFQSTNRLELREERADVPVVVSRHEFDINQLGIYAEICRREFADNPIDERRAHRTLIGIMDINSAYGRTELYVTVPNWRPDEAIILPTACIASTLVPQLKVGDYLLGDVNIGAEEEDDLYFKNVNEIVKADEITGT